MARALIVFGSTTGNTEFVARHIGASLSEKGVDVEMKDVVRTTVSDLLSTSGLVVLGCSTWGEEEIGLQEDFEPFQLQLATADLSGRQFALFLAAGIPGINISAARWICLRRPFKKVEASFCSHRLRSMANQMVRWRKSIVGLMSSTLTFDYDST